MRKPLVLFAAASLSAGVFAFLGYDNSVFGKDDQQKSADVSGSSSSTSGLSSSASAKGHASLPQGTTKAEVSDEAGIRATLQKVTIAAVKDDNLSDLSNYLCSSDKQKTRLSQANEQLKTKLQQLRQDFKAKYNEDFAPDEMAFGKSYESLTIVQGEVVNPALLSNFPVESSGKSGSTSGGAGSSNLRSDASGTSGGLSGSASTSSGGIGASASTSADRNSSSSSSGIGASSTADRSSSSSSSGISKSTGIQKGFAVAIVTFPQTQVAPEVVVSLVRESATGATGAGTSGSSTGTGSSTGIGSSSSAPRSDASSTSGAGTSSSSSSSSNAGSLDRFSSSSSGAGTASTADRSSTSSGLYGSGRNASGQAGGSDWKVKLPDNVTADQLQQNLAKHIDEVCQMKEKWPTDKTEAYRMIGQHVFEAFYDTGGSTGTGATGTGATGTGASGTTGTGAKPGSGLGTGSDINRQQ